MDTTFATTLQQSYIHRVNMKHSEDNEDNRNKKFVIFKIVETLEIF